MELGESLNGIGKGLLVDLWVLGAEAIADGSVGDTGEFEVQLRRSS